MIKIFHHAVSPGPDHRDKCVNKVVRQNQISTSENGCEKAAAVAAAA